jgi:hypothetical protein
VIATTSTLGVFSVAMVGPYLAFLDRRDFDQLASLKQTLRWLRSGFVAAS